MCLVRILVLYDAWQVAVKYDLYAFKKDKEGVHLCEHTNFYRVYADAG